MSTKLFIGPMSKNVVDAVLELEKSQRNKIGFIPSRRQIERTGGYVNKWTTNEFANYVAGQVPIQRDHGGPGQGTDDDDGFESFAADAVNLDIIHIDPWKKYQDYETGLLRTVEYIEFVNQINPEVLFEVGTEEAIRRFEEDEFEKLLFDLQNSLRPELYDKIKYAVVQSGVWIDLLYKENTGKFSIERLNNMSLTAHKYGLKSKEHNGDYLTPEEIQKRFDNGLDAINIAPEFGQIETGCYLDHMNSEQIEEFFKLCYDSGRWEKWVSIEEVKQIDQLISVCGHYVFAEEKFKEIKPQIDEIVKGRIKQRIAEILK